MMSMIHSRKICHTAIIVLLLNFVLLSSHKPGYALSYWDAVFEIGFNPVTQDMDSTTACKQIERMVNYRNAVRQLPVVDENLNAKIQEVESRISSLDAGNLYNQLPYTDIMRVWRGIGVRGALGDNHYRLGIVDPAIETWLQSYLKGMPQLWGPQNQFGDFGLRAFIRPVTEETFKLVTEAHTYIDDLNSANMVRLIEQWANVMGRLAEDGDHPPPTFLKGSGLDEKSLKVIYGLARDFPHCFAIVNRYCTIENIVSGDTNESNGAKTFDIAVMINASAIRKDYPYIGELIERLKGMLSFQATGFDSRNRPLFTMGFDGHKYLFSMRFRTLDGRFLVLDKNPDNRKQTGVGLTDSGDQSFFIMYSFRLNIVGLKLNIEALKVDLDYFFDDYGANVRARLQRPPEKVTAEGLVMGFLPIWLVDFFIPSNIENMTQEFFQTLASGNDGQGVSMLLGSIPGEPSKSNLWLLTDAEVLSNGTMKFAFNLQQEMVREEANLFKDIKAFEQKLWEAFYLDFLRIKSLKCYLH